MKKEDSEMFGWGCFVFGCIFFLIDALRSENVVLLFGSILFLAGCIILAIPQYFPEE